MHAQMLWIFALTACHHCILPPNEKCVKCCISDLNLCSKRWFHLYIYNMIMVHNFLLYSFIITACMYIMFTIKPIWYKLCSQSNSRINWQTIINWHRIKLSQARLSQAKNYFHRSFGRENVYLAAVTFVSQTCCCNHLPQETKISY